MELEIAVVLIGGCFALLGTILGAHLNKRSTLSTARELAEIERFKYTQDRIWDFRKESYTAILAHLNKALTEARKLHVGYLDEQSHPETFFASEERKNIEEAMWAAWKDCRQEFEHSRLTVSDDFAKQFQLLMHGFRLVDDNDLPPEKAEKLSDIFDGGYYRLLGVAQDEIAPATPNH